MFGQPLPAVEQPLQLHRPPLAGRVPVVDSDERMSLVQRCVCLVGVQSDAWW